MGEAISRKQKLGAIAGLFAVAIIWGSTFTVNKMALDTLTPISLMAGRFFVAFVLMLAIFHKRFKGLGVKDCMGGILCGISLFLAVMLQTYGLLYTDAGKQAFLSGSYVICVPFLTWLVFKKRPRLRVYLGAGLCFFGISLLSLNESFRIGLGDSLTLISSVLFATQIVIAGFFISREDAAVMSTVQFGVMGLLSLLTVLLLRDGSLFTQATTHLFSPAIFAIVYLGVLGTAVAYYLQIYCQKYTAPTTTSIILSMETVFGSLIAVAVLGDVFSIKMVLGAVAILASVLIAEL